MMRPFVRLCPRISHSRSLQKGSIFLSRLSSSRGLSIPLGCLQGSLLSVWQLPFHRCPPGLLPLLPAVGRGGNFEGSSPPSQPQVGGILGQHWSVWQSFCANEWIVSVLRDGYRVPFHHLPPVSLEPRALPSCSPGSVCALVLPEVVSKMLQKGVLEPVDHPSPSFYSCLFIVEKVTEGWRPVIDLSALNGFVTLTKFQMETVASVLGSIRKGYWMISIDLKDTYFQIAVHVESWPYIRSCL